MTDQKCTCDHSASDVITDQQCPIHGTPKKFRELIWYFAERMSIQRTLRELELPLSPDTPNDVKSEARKWRKMLSYVPADHHYKLPMAIEALSYEVEKEREQNYANQSRKKSSDG